MTEYTIKCKENPNDIITASAEPADGDVAFIVRNAGSFRASVYISPADARSFARGILALADEVDGGEVAKAVPAVKVGDRIRIITAGSRGARVRAGETFMVREVTESDVQVDGNGSNGRWYLSPDDVEIVDEADASVAPLAEKGPTLPTRAELLSQARDLMSGEDYTAHDLIALADYLAGESA